MTMPIIQNTQLEADFSMVNFEVVLQCISCMVWPGLKRGPFQYVADIFLFGILFSKLFRPL